MIGLTKKQSRCLSAIHAYQCNGVQATFERIAVLIGTTSKGRVAVLIAALEERGAITRTKHDSGYARKGDITLTPTALEYLNTLNTGVQVAGALATCPGGRSSVSERINSAEVTR